MELKIIWQINKILKGYLSEFFGPLDPTNPKETLKVGVERRDRGVVQLDPILMLFSNGKKVLRRRAY